MKLLITKSARQFGYLIWNSTNNADVDKLFGGKTKIHVHFNGFDIGEKAIDWKYHRISIGYKFTRALPESAKYYVVALNKGILEVNTTNE